MEDFLLKEWSHMIKRVSNDSLEVMSNLTLLEKARLVIGKSFWKIHGVDRFQIKDIYVADGPHGLRKQVEGTQLMDINNSVAATCFPTAVTLASSWDCKLVTEVGIALGEEFMSEGVSVALGPGANIKRSPLCGRNFEYFSEDPFLTGEMAASYIEGVQFVGVGTSLKHFAVNNQEKNRMTINAFVDERSLREIYLAGFERAIKRAKPWTVMCAYNKINGVYASENKYLLSDILRHEWEYEGVTLTDWGASNDRVEGIRAGMDLQMPGPDQDSTMDLVKAVEKGDLTVAQIESSVKRVIDLTLKGNNNRREMNYDMKKHHQLARKAACESSVLLKNEARILPLSKDEHILVIGDFGIKPRYQGAGSSHVNPISLSIPMKSHPYQDKVTFCRGYDERYESTNHTLIEQAVSLARSGEKVIILAGLTESFESEGFDRSHLSIPKSQIELIQSITSVNDNVVVVLMNGAPIEMPWIGKVKGILEMYLSGQAVGEAIWDLLYGEVNPSGKLAETFPDEYQALPISKLFPMGPKGVEYREGLYVGYRYFDAVDRKPLFPFGYGLSYTYFEYKDLMVETMDIQPNQTVPQLYQYKVSFTVANIGSYDGKEVSQLYISPMDHTYYRPVKELKGFKKTFIKQGESERIEFMLDRRSFAHYDPLAKDWVVEKGRFKISVGSSSIHLQLEQIIEVTGHAYSEEAKVLIHESQSAYEKITHATEFTRNDFETLYGSKIIHELPARKGTYSYNSTVEELSKTAIGKTLLNSLNIMMKLNASKTEKKSDPMMERMLMEMPLRGISMMSEGKFDRKKVQSILDVANGKMIRGMRDLIASFRKIEE